MQTVVASLLFAIIGVAIRLKPELDEAATAAVHFDADDAHGLDQGTRGNFKGAGQEGEEIELTDVPTNQAVELSVASALAQRSLSRLQQDLAIFRNERCPETVVRDGALKLSLHRAFVKIVSGELVGLMTTVQRQRRRPFNAEVHWLALGGHGVQWSHDPCASLTEDQSHLAGKQSLLQNDFSEAGATASFLQRWQPSLTASRAATSPRSLTEIWAAQHRLRDLVSDASSKKTYDVRLDETRKACFPENGTAVVPDQGICGSCWVFAAVGAAEDRHCMASPASLLHTSDTVRHQLSVQQILSCSSAVPGGCDGGHVESAFNFMIEHPLALSSAFEYQVRCLPVSGGKGAVKMWTPQSCRKFAHLSDDDPKKPCHCVEGKPLQQPSCPKELLSNADLGGEHPRFGLTGYDAIPSPGSRKTVYGTETYSIAEVVAMMQGSLLREGPVVVTHDVYADFYEFGRYRGKGVYKWNRKAESHGTHAAVVIGWGESDGSDPYWVIRNSWGKAWADSGHFRMLRGNNECGVETLALSPTVRPLTRHRNLVLQNAQVFVGLRDVDGTKDSSGTMWLSSKHGGLTGHKVLFWDFVVDCIDDRGHAATCMGLSAMILDLDTEQAKQAQQERVNKLWCCCDTNNFPKPGRCLLVPPEQGLEGSKQCGKHNFGRGHTQTHRSSTTPAACELDGPSQFHRTELQLPVESLPNGSLRVAVDLLKYKWLRGQHRLRLTAKLARETIPKAMPGSSTVMAEMERTQDYRIILSDSDLFSNGVWPLPGFAAVNVGLHTMTVAVAPANGLPQLYRYKDKTLVQADVVCSAACTAVEARFLDMNSSYHPDGVSATRLQPVPQSYDQTVLSWQSDVQLYPSGTFQLLLVAELASGQVIRHIESITLPSNPDGQGLWQPLQIVDMHIRLRTDKAHWNPQYRKVQKRVPVQPQLQLPQQKPLQELAHDFFSPPSYFREKMPGDQQGVQYRVEMVWEGGYDDKEYQEVTLRCSRRCEIKTADLRPKSPVGGAVQRLQRTFSKQPVLQWRVEDFQPAGPRKLEVCVASGELEACEQYDVHIPRLNSWFLDDWVGSGGGGGSGGADGGRSGSCGGGLGSLFTSMILLLQWQLML